MLSPGLTNSPKFQTVKIKGSLSGCTGVETSARFKATLKTTQAVTCAALSGAGATATQPFTLSIKWLPKSGESGGTLNIPLTETPEASFSGMVTEGVFAPSKSSISGTLSEAFTSSNECGAGKKVKDGTASLGSTTVQP